jgi:hypothetical protein
VVYSRRNIECPTHCICFLSVFLFSFKRIFFCYQFPMLFYSLCCRKYATQCNMQHNAICYTMRYATQCDVTQCNMQHNAICYTMQYATQCDMQHNAICNTMRYATQCNMLHNAICNTMQYATQCNMIKLVFYKFPIASKLKSKSF